MSDKTNTNLKEAGLKATLPRIKILEILQATSGTHHHYTAEDIYRELVINNYDIGLATVYRVLTQFESAGLVIRHHFEGGQSVFELDGGEHHDHLVCVQCGHVEEFTDNLIEAQQAKIAKEKNFKMTDHNLYIYGICHGCQEC